MNAILSKASQSELSESAIAALIMQQPQFCRAYEVLELLGVWSVCDRSSGKVVAGKLATNKYFIRSHVDPALTWQLASLFASYGFAPCNACAKGKEGEWTVCHTKMTVQYNQLRNLWRYWRRGGKLAIFLQQHWQAVKNMAPAQEFVYVETEGGESSFMSLTDFAFRVVLSNSSNK